ncbi:MAG: LamG domain-containing protein [Phycisphaerae bacterium]
MSKKLIYLVSFVLVLSLLTSVANAAEKSYLIGWWKFDGDLLDSSGLGNHGNAEGNPTFVAGKIGSNALDLDGDDFVIIDGVADDITSNEITLSAWLKTTSGSDTDWFSCNTAGAGNVIRFCIDNTMAAFDTDTEHALSTTTVTDGQWHLLTFVRSRMTGYVYVDGVLENSDTAIYNFSPDDLWSIGQEWDGANDPSGFLTGTVDDVRIYDRPLPADLVLDLFNGIEPVFVNAENPEPADGAILEDTWVSLNWSAGDTAASHDVYFGENYNDVADGTGDTSRGNQAVTFYVAGFPGFPYPDGLVPGTTYYWRIDEVEADGTTKHTGDVWSFMVTPKKAYNPDPPDGGKYVDPDVELSWTAGYGAKLHTVYFGDNFDDVHNATGGLPQAVTTYTPGTLEMDKTYYWRVDEFDVVATHKGDVWSFSTKPIIAITDPNLIGWWKFDEGSGNTAIDFSGHGNDGKLGGGQNWVDGIIGGALDLRGSDYVSIDGVVDDITSNDITLSAWIKTTQTGEGNVFASNTGSSHVLQFGIDNGNVWVDDGPDVDFPPAINDDQWHMITLVMEGSRIYVYTDGVQVGQITTIIDITNETRWSIGQEWDPPNPSDLYVGMVDDARFYDVALTADEVKELMRGDPLVAWNPSPDNNSTVDIDEAKQPISWSAGDKASEHDVYFGADKTAVDKADASDTTGIYRGRQGAIGYSIPEALEWGGGPYYWRIDEYNTDGTISTGGIWSFSVADYLIIDDFEDYDTGENQIWYAWEDGLGYGIPGTPPYSAGNGTGSAVGDETTYSYTEETIVHGGSQAMPVYYDNNQQAKLKYSEVVKTLSSLRDWTREGVGVLTIWFRGNSDNAAETLYVALNGNAIVTNDDSAAAQVETWTQWNIDLQAFADQGVNLANVNTIAIGLGNKKNPAAGGSGTMYIDDIRLYRPAP